MNLPALAQGGDDDGVRRLAAEILSRSEYAGTKKMLHSLDAVLEWLRWLRQMLGWGDLLETNPVLYYAILFTLLLVSAALIAHIVWSVRRALAAAAPAAGGAAAPEGPQFSAEAEELARQGRFLEAARRLQLGVLDLLLRGRLLELARSDPNRVLRRRLAETRLPEGERRDLLRLLDRFETSWFRDREEDPDLYEGWRALYQRLAGGGTAA